jgi:hypothetical protein
MGRERLNIYIFGLQRNRFVKKGQLYIDNLFHVSTKENNIMFTIFVLYI